MTEIHLKAGQILTLQNDMSQETIEKLLAKKGPIWQGLTDGGGTIGVIKRSEIIAIKVKPDK